MSAVTAMAVLVVTGCDGSEDEAERAATVEPSQSFAVAEVGERPTYPPAPTEGWDPRPPKPTVIASGTTGSGEPFELVMRGTSKGTCISTTFPAHKSEGGGRCGEDLFQPLSGTISAIGESTSGKGIQLEGLVSSEVDAVELSYEGNGDTETLEAITEQISPRLLRQAGEMKPIGVFVAFLPDGVDPSDVTATALDAEGEALGMTRWPDL
jgi:hypothetical protein